ncbi:MAG: hypothetical protein MI861_04620 [Pirellulales bacterium]|nr:hypothetical protein [Pirellulales bacterium]
MRWPLLIVSALLWIPPANGQQFELLEPDGSVAAAAQLERGRLVITERTGQRFFFEREVRYNSPDGRFDGFIEVGQNRVLRFPRSGQGKMQVADLKQPTPRFRYTRRSVRPRPRPPLGQPRPPLGQPRPPLGQPLPPPAALPGPGILGYPPFSPGGGIYVPITLQPHLYFPAYGHPRSVLIQSQYIPNPALPPADLKLFNSGPRDIQVELVDFRNATSSRSFRIKPQGSVAVEVQRDAGGRKIDRYRTYDPWGNFTDEEVVRPILPAIRYEIVVHQWNLQSVAIDRTGKNPHPIMDVNFQGHGLGRFPLPPGDRLQSGPYDVYRHAVESRNQGTVAPILAEENPNPGASPLERAILEAQQRALRGR